MNYVSISGESREVAKSKGAKSIRKEGKVPCVLYGLDENVHFSVKPLDMRSIIYTPDFKGAEISIDGKMHKAIVKDVSFHPVTDEITHIDFLALKPGHPVKVWVPVRQSGKAPGVIEGGKLITKLRKLHIKAAPENLVDELTLDISTLRIGHIGRVSDVVVPGNIEVLSNGASPVAFVKRPRVAVELDEEEDDLLEAAEAAPAAEA